MSRKFFGFSQNTGDLAAKSTVQADARATIAEQVVEIRQAVKSDLNGEPIEELSAGRLAFTTQNYETGEIERVVYERKECVEGECELWVYRYEIEYTDGITTIFATEPREASFIMGSVLVDKPLFVGIEYSGDPLVRVTVDACGSSDPCDFPIVGITLRVRPHPTSGGATVPVELHEEVRIRSV